MNQKHVPVVWHMIIKKLPASVNIFSNTECSRCSVAKMHMKEFKASAGWLKTVILNILNYFHIDVLRTRSVRKVSDRIFLCEHLMDYNLARLHEPTLNLSAHA